MSAKLKEIPAKSVGPTQGSSLFDSLSTGEVIETTHTDELVIALCGPMGSPLHEVATKLQEMLQSSFKYETCTIIRLSGFIEAHANRASRPIRATPANRRHDLITLGDEMRKNAWIGFLYLEPAGNDDAAKTLEEGAQGSLLERVRGGAATGRSQA